MSEIGGTSLVDGAESLARRLPGLGFIYLSFVVCVFGLYIYWIYSPGWYNGASSNADQAAKQASYIEKIVQDFSADQQASLRKEQLTLYQQTGNVTASRQLLSRLDSGSRRQGELQALLMANSSPSASEAVRVERLLEQEVAGKAVSTWTDMLSLRVVEFLAAHSSPELASVVLEQLLLPTNPLPGVPPKSRRLLGVESDQWILGGAPGYILSRQSQDGRLVLTLGVYADASDFPITVQVSRGDERVEEVLTRADNVQVELAIIANQLDVIAITTDKFWSLPSDAREFSVRLVNVEFQ